MNKKTAFVFIIIILIVAIPILIHFQTSEKNNIEPSEPTVKITDFVVDNQWSYLGGLVFDRSFNLTIENKEADNITDLELKVKVYANNSEVQVGNYFVGTYENGLNFASNETSVIAMVLLNNTVLDERPFT